MKTYIKTTFAAAVVALTTSCADLDVEVKSQYTEYPTESEVALDAKMADVYVTKPLLRTKRPDLASTETIMTELKT